MSFPKTFVLRLGFLDSKGLMKRFLSLCGKPHFSAHPQPLRSCCLHHIKEFHTACLCSYLRTVTVTVQLGAAVIFPPICPGAVPLKTDIVNIKSGPSAAWGCPFAICLWFWLYCPTLTLLLLREAPFRSSGFSFAQQAPYIESRAVQLALSPRRPITSPSNWKCRILFHACFFFTQRVLLSFSAALSFVMVLGGEGNRTWPLCSQQALWFLIDPVTIATRMDMNK